MNVGHMWNSSIHNKMSSIEKTAKRPPLSSSSANADLQARKPFSAETVDTLKDWLYMHRHVSKKV